MIDVAAEMSGEEAYFYDDIHLNERGAEKLADRLAKWFLQYPTAPTVARKS